MRRWDQDREKQRGGRREEGYTTDHDIIHTKTKTLVHRKHILHILNTVNALGVI